MYKPDEVKFVKTFKYKRGMKLLIVCCCCLHKDTIKAIENLPKNPTGIDYAKIVDEHGKLRYFLRRTDDCIVVTDRDRVIEETHKIECAFATDELKSK